MIKNPIIDEIVEYLKNHDQAERIKKLMYYADTKKWAKNSQEVERLSCRDLVEKLREANSSIDQLSYLMTRMVETLNRQDIYSNIANIIIQNLSKLYNDSEDTTQIVFVENKKSSQLIIDDYLIDRVVANLEENIDSTRIKKLIFCTCKKHWENNPHILEQYSLYDLIYELRQQNHDLNQVKQSLQRVVKTLNRQAVYSNIANIIIQASQILYQTSEVEANQGIKNKAIDNFETALLDGDLDYFYEEQGLIPSIDQTQESTAENENDINTNVKAVTKQKVYDIFEIRMSLMQYANPLRAKILLFSILDHNFDDSWQDWSALKTCELDDLIHDIYNRTQSIRELESTLLSTAKTLPDVSEYQQAAHGIITALKPYYY